MSANSGTKKHQGQEQERELRGEIEFPATHSQSGIDIIRYFLRVIRQRYPDTPANIRISQEEMTIRLTIETDEGHGEVIEQSLQKYGSEVISDGMLHIGLGQTLLLPDNRYVHRCGNCAETWLSKQREPTNCPRSRDEGIGFSLGDRPLLLAVYRHLPKRSLGNSGRVGQRLVLISVKAIKLSTSNISAGNDNIIGGIVRDNNDRVLCKIWIRDRADICPGKVNDHHAYKCHYSD